MLCRLLTASHRDAPKGEAALAWEEFLSHLALPGASGLIALPDPASPPERLEVLRELFGPERLALPLQRRLDGLDLERTRDTLAAARRLGVRVLATNDVHYHVAGRRMLHDVLTATRAGASLSRAGTRLFSNAERCLKSPAEMARLFRDLPEALANTLAIAERCVFSPSELRYRYPSEWIPQGETAQRYLERLTWEGARARYAPDSVPDAVTRQLRHELTLIRQLQFADYFLTIWEIVDYARRQKILCQGRGSAANSAVCYCLGITAVDPVRMNLLFERFLSVERGEPPDIDVDFEHERREEVIQYVYQKYGRDRAAMVAAVVTYRERLSLREVRKALELPVDGPRGEDPDPRVAPLVEELQGFPRHLSIHSGGFTLSADPIIETVPVEPARMEGRTIVQWDKDDLDAIGLLKVDLLSLGMLTALRKTIAMVNTRHGEAGGAPELSLATIPAEDPATYAMIRKADTVGTFQIESRAQMSMLPRLLPRTFYDLVIQVAIVRPGPIVGKMVHPYLRARAGNAGPAGPAAARRRRGQEEVDYPHPLLRDILGRTLGVPLFQEQVMKMAILLAGFSPGEADRLRKAVNGWRSRDTGGTVAVLGVKLMEGLRKSGLSQEYAQRIFDQIQGFAEYGFPESHSASFALLAYASAYLKRHHPAEFTCALLNSQPMGFYSSHTLIDDAKRHGVRVLPVHPNLSDWDCRMEDDGALRVGLRTTRGLAHAAASALVAARAERPFAGLGDFLARARLRRDVAERLAMGGAFECFGYDQRHALWQILAHEITSRQGETPQLELFSGQIAAPGAPEASGLFAPLSVYESVHAEYAAYGLSAHSHPMQALRGLLPPKTLPELTTARIKETLRTGRTVRAAGMVIVRQRPPTAKGVTFATLEDEDGFLDLILHAKVRERYDSVFLEHSFMVAEGTLQRNGDAASLLVRRLAPIELSEPATTSRDFR